MALRVVGATCAILLTACASTSAPATVSWSAPPGVVGAVARRSPPPGDPCERPPLGTARGQRAPGPPPRAERETAQARRAHDAFEKRAWPEAERALRDVVAGTTGDDAGNRQLAEMDLAIVLFRVGRFEESAAILRTIAHRPEHLKFAEALIWLVQLAREHPDLFRFDDLADYPEAALDKFDNGQQRDTWGAAQYLVGRLRYDQGDFASAERHFAKAASLQPWFREADLCLRRVVLLEGGSASTAR